MAETQTEEVPSAGAVVRRGFGSTELALSADVQSAALAAQAQAEVQARWLIAQKCPRDWKVVESELLAECGRIGFAMQAEYAKPIGGSTVKGPSIRFVEQALRCMGNIYAPTTVISDDDKYRRLQVVVTDLETNVSWPKQISIRKTVERTNAKGRKVVAQRHNSSGALTYEVEATDDELQNKENAMVSKAIRTAGLRMLPGDLVDAAMEVCRQTLRKVTGKDLKVLIAKMVEAFGKVKVTEANLVEWLGHGMATITVDELEELRGLREAIAEGEAKWEDAIEQRKGVRPAAAGEVTAPPAPTPKPPPPAAAAETKPPAGETKPVESNQAPPAATPVAETKAAPTETKPVEAKPSPPKVEELDDLQKEVASIRAALQAAAKKGDLAPITNRIYALPPDLSGPLKKELLERGKALPQ